MTLISQFSFNEGSGSTAFDSSGNNYDLTASDSVNSWGVGKTGNGAKQQFTGSLGPDLSMDSWTVMFWVKIPAIPSDWTGLVVQPVGPVGNQYWLELDPSAHISIWTNTASIVSTSSLPIDTWTHVAVVYEWPVGSTIYINGSLDASGPYGAGINFGVSGQTWYVAAAADASRDPAGFDGVMDDLRLFNTILTSGEIATWMNTPANQPATLLSTYGFNEGSGSTTADLSGNGYDLTTDGSGWVTNGRTGGGGKDLFSGFIGPNAVQSEWTVMAWVKRNGAASPYGAIVSNYNNFWLELWGTDRVECYAGVSGHPSSGSGVITDNTWMHVAATRGLDGTGKVYVNGVLVATGVGNAMNFGVNTWYIGGAAGDPNYTLSGTVDDVRIFSGALLSSEIITWMNTPVVPVGRKFRLGTSPKPLMLGSTEKFFG